jgi:hypothetical protein
MMAPRAQSQAGASSLKILNILSKFAASDEELLPYLLAILAYI